LAGLINALRVTDRTDITRVRVVVSGVGSAGVAISRLLLKYGFKDMLFCDSKGIIHEGRNDLNKEKIELIGKSSRRGFQGLLQDAIKDSDVFIGVSKAGALTEEMAKSMNNDAIVFALANPVPEIMPEVAERAGIAVIATGRSDFKNQLNNSLIFPGIFKGILQLQTKQFDEQVFMNAALALSSYVKNPTKDMILPAMFDIGLVDYIAKSVVEK
jgi:malate dehydrogenase (oxaloacetate-decarboxylating)